jgi:hypothetical protein
MNEFIQEKACDNCPFNESGAGRILRDSLAPGRFASIKADLLKRLSFNCHETTHETGDGTEKICAGALAFQRQHGCVPDTVQVAERLTAINESRKPRW